MTSLLFFSGIGKKAVIAMIITSTLTLALAAQRVEPQRQGRRYGDSGFRGEPINLNVVNADIRDILNYITEQYGINFVIDKSVGKIPVTVNVTDVPWNFALDSIMRSQELGIQVNGTILRVADSKTLASEGEIYRAQQNNQLDSSALYTEFIRLNYARAVGTLASAGGGSGPTAGMVTGNSPTFSGGGASSGGAAAGNQGILGIVKRRLSRRGSVEVDGRSNTLIVTDVRENIDAVRQLVTLLDQPEPQVEIEARIVVATRTFSRDIGVQLSGLLLGRRGSGGGLGTLPGAPVDTGRLGDLPPGMPRGGVNNNLASEIANTALGLTTGVFGTAQLNLLITAGEEKGQAKVIATPRVTTLNNRKAEIKSGVKIPVTTVQPGAGAGGFAVATTEYVDVPLKLEVTPQITDVGTVILNVTAENSSIAPLASGAAPAINTQSMQTEVTVPDGGTTVIGGVLSDDERDSVNRTPGLSRIPLLGNLFKRKNVSRDTAEILFFITPRIYRPEFADGVTATAGTKPKTTTIVQPVPLGNPASNSDPVPVIPVSNPAVPTAPGPQPASTPRQQ